MILLLISINTQAQQLQEDSLRTKKNALAISSATGLVGLNTALYFAWYANYNTGKFHTFNDNNEWQGADKLGHTFTTFNLGKAIINASYNAGWQSPKQQLLAGSVGLLFMTSIEIQDGFSRGWGFSWGDVAANTIGTALAVWQGIALKNNYPLQLKFLYIPSSIAQYNPKLLGSSASERVLKDYNAQSYWLCFYPKQLFAHSTLPAYLGVSLGYKATGMLGAHNNDAFNTSYYRTQRYYLSVDIDVSKLKTKHKWLNKTLSAISFIKIPLPALSVDNKGVWRGQLLPWSQ
ncbi:MAG: DUF2279 domain-containing protein [Bacteroidia bacterium]|nr:DUF2279 domain-containing protein [Bacteroidia bacterium]